MRRFACLLAFALAACSQPNSEEAPKPSPRAPTWVDVAVPIERLESDASNADLDPLRSSFVGARVIAIGEATHGSHEFFALRERLLVWSIAERVGELHRAQRPGRRALEQRTGLLELSVAANVAIEHRDLGHRRFDRERAHAKLGDRPNQQTLAQREELVRSVRGLADRDHARAHEARAQRIQIGIGSVRLEPLDRHRHV
ncbi:MAG TPA: hypothetical protein VM869_24580, partial [Enhygromyxa sp.]|nr:hypothetical protein [Enhygromyxa sp.]